MQNMIDRCKTLFDSQGFFLSVDRNSESPIGADQLEDQDAGHFQKSSCSGITVHVYTCITYMYM